MEPITYDDGAIIINGTDTVPTTEKRIDVQYKGTSKFSVDGDGKVSAANLGYLEQDTHHTFYVDGNRTDTYTANGTFFLPYLTISAALTVINALSLAHQTANTYDQANYVIEVAQGEYDEDLTIGNVKNLRFNLHGATISGNITYTTTMVGGTADYYYSRLEFAGAVGNRPEKGTAGRITGTITATRNNDSLCYVSFAGIDLAGNVAFNTNGTWVVQMHSCMLSARFSCGDSAIALLETTGHTIITGHIAAAADGTSVTAVSLYSVDNTEFDLINISNAAGSRITNCRFNSDVTITAGNVSIDVQSNKSLMAQTETLTGATIVALDNYLPSQVLASQTTENNNLVTSLTSDSTFITGSDITYSGGRGSAVAKLTAVWSAVSGAFSSIYSSLTSSGNIAAAGDGVVGIKQVVTNTGACTDGSMYGGQFISKHNHATNKMANEAPLIGLEAFAYDAGAAPAGTMIGGNFGYHNEGTTAKDGGAVYRGVQVFCDDAAGSTAPSEASGVTIWNQAGTQTNAINIVKSDGGFTQDITLQNGETISNATNGKVLVSGVLAETVAVGYATKTIKKTIGGIGITADFNFVTAANANEQVIDLGAIIPAKARILDAMTFTDAVFTGATTLVAETGISSSGAELIASATIYAANAITAQAHTDALNNAPSASAGHVYVSATPGANWSLVTAGKVSVYITYIDVTNI